MCLGWEGYSKDESHEEEHGWSGVLHPTVFYIWSFTFIFIIQLQEEENSRLATTKRRLQREIDELTEQNETLQRDLTNAKKR